jgi:hypothetical protein
MLLLRLKKAHKISQKSLRKISMQSAKNMPNTSIDNGKIIDANGIKIWYETFGNAHHPALLLLMGDSCDAYM